MRRRFDFALIVATGILVFACAANGKDWPPAGDKECSANHFHDNDLVSHAESRDQRLPNGSTNYINPGENGSIRVHGWNNSDVLVRACIVAAAPSDTNARALASQVAITRSTGDIEPSGPSTGDRRYWGVSYEVWVPAVSTSG